MELSNEQAEQLEPLAATAATVTYRRINDGLGWNDLKATALLWAVAHPQKAMEWLGHEDPKQGNKLLLTAMCNATMRATQKERAQRIGYRVSDLYYYTAEQIRNDLLPALWDRDAWVSPPQSEDQNADRGVSLPNERGGWMTLLADVGDALRILPTEQRQLLFLKYGMGWSTAELSVDKGITEKEVEYSLGKAVKAIHHRLGGDRPQECTDDCECRTGPLVAPRHNRNGERLAELERGYEG